MGPVLQPVLIVHIYSRIINNPLSVCYLQVKPSFKNGLKKPFLNDCLVWAFSIFCCLFINSSKQSYGNKKDKSDDRR